MSGMDIRIAIYDGFLDALNELPDKIQKKVRELMKKFRKDPKSPGLNYETLSFRDSKVRSLRVDQTYRAILVKPERGNVYLLVHVAHHDNAYDWAKNRRFDINPQQGSIQVYDEAEVAAAMEPAEGEVRGHQPDPVLAGLFGELSDEALERCGVPDLLRPSIRAVHSEADLDRLAALIPAEISDVLYLVAAGTPVEEALEEAERARAVHKVDVDDFEAAMEHPDTKRRFHIVEDDAELEAMLNAPLEKWRVFLHPSQEKIVRMKSNGPIRVLGGAGTGKTVALMHRARHLARRVFSASDQRLLVTTFTKNLARDLDANLKTLCGPERERIDVVHLHLFCVRFLRERGLAFNIAGTFQSKTTWESVLRDLPEQDQPLGFFLDEWSQVVQGNDIQTVKEYLKVRRRGRGTRLSAKQRLGIWKAMEAYRAELDRQGLVEWPDVVRKTREFLEAHPEERPYRSVLADEVQDFSAGELRLLRTLAPNETDALFLTGDAHQRIYGHVARLSECGIDIRGRSRRLKVNYRTTQKIRNRAVAVLEGVDIDDLDGGQDDLRGYHSLRPGVEPRFHHAASADEEAEAIGAILKEWLDEKGYAPEQICVAARNRKAVEGRLLEIVSALGRGATVIETDPDHDLDPGIRLATMHRLKGLEYPCVLVADVRQGVLPQRLPVDLRSDDLAASRHEDQERRLLYVAMTRARDELAITGYGGASPLLPRP
jgi:mRNA-degrading endonuclease RelE of RelBE toxin-antitoxin system